MKSKMLMRLGLLKKQFKSEQQFISYVNSVNMGKLNRFFNNEQKKLIKKKNIKNQKSGDLKETSTSLDDESTRDLNQEENKLNTVFLGNEKNAIKNKIEVKEENTSPSNKKGMPIPQNLASMPKRTFRVDLAEKEKSFSQERQKKENENSSELYFDHEYMKDLYKKSIISQRKADEHVFTVNWLKESPKRIQKNKKMLEKQKLL